MHMYKICKIRNKTRVYIPKVPMRFVSEILVSGEFKRSFVRPNTGNHLCADSVALNDVVLRVAEDALGLIRHRPELIPGDPVAPDPECAELLRGAQKQIGGGPRE